MRTVRLSIRGWTILEAISDEEYNREYVDVAVPYPLSIITAKSDQIDSTGYTKVRLWRNHKTDTFEFNG